MVKRAVAPTARPVTSVYHDNSGHLSAYHHIGCRSVNHDMMQRVQELEDKVARIQVRMDAMDTREAERKRSTRATRASEPWYAVVDADRTLVWCQAAETHAPCLPRAGVSQYHRALARGEA